MLVAGLGVAGLAAVRALAGGDRPVRAWAPEAFPPSPEEQAEVRRLGVDVCLDADGLAALDADPSPSWLVKSPGLHDGHPLIGEALARRMPMIDEAELGWRLDSRPFVGVTGTNGKSTVSTLIAAVLERHGAAPSVAGNKERAPALSSLPGMPDPDVVVAEISSFQLRHSPELLPDLAVFTNCTEDSWHRHGGREGYAADKRRMFVRGERAAPTAVVNVDDPLGASLAREVGARGGLVVRYGTGTGLECQVLSCAWDLRRAQIELDLGGNVLDLSPRLPGAHNALNVAAALGFAQAAGIPVEEARAAIEGADPVPGRLQPIDEGQSFDVLVDFAHNPDGLKRVLETIRATLGRRSRGGRLVAVASALPVFDEHQYVEMARAVAAGADLVVATSERVSSDVPMEWPPAFFATLRRHAPDLTVVVDRREAIAHAIGSAGPEDVVVLLGRGIRRHPIYAEDGEPFTPDDAEDARRVLRGLA